MIKEGLIEEVKQIYDRKIYSKPIINGIGYKELYKYFEGNLSLEESINLIKTNSRRYAKRQYTWLNNKINNIKWFEVNFNDFNKTLEEIKEYIKKNINKN